MEVRFTLTAEQYAEAKQLCDAFRLKVPELAKAGMFSVMASHATDDSNVWMLDVMEDANADRDTGVHSGFQNYMDARPAELVRRI